MFTLKVKNTLCIPQCEQKQTFFFFHPWHLQSHLWKVLVFSWELFHQQSTLPDLSSLAEHVQWQKYLADLTVSRWSLSLACHDSLSITGGVVMDGEVLKENFIHKANSYRRMPWRRSGPLPGGNHRLWNEASAASGNDACESQETVGELGLGFKKWEWKYLENFRYTSTYIYNISKTVSLTHLFNKVFTYVCNHDPMLPMSVC